MSMSGRALVASRQLNLPAPQPQSAVTTRAFTNLPVVAPAVAGGIRGLMVAFAAGPAMEDSDTKHLLGIYVEAVSGFDEAVATHVLNHLKFHNPRNPWRPTPQDVHEQCQLTEKNWRARIADYFFHSCWGQELGSPPLTEGCRIPKELAKHFFRQRIDSELQYGDCLHWLSREVVIQIPEECWGPGQRGSVLQVISARERLEQQEQEARQRRLEKYGVPLE